MDLDFLFWLAIAAVYILQALASKRKKPAGPPADASSGDQAEMPSELEEALGEIGRVLRGEQSGPSPLPEPHYEVETERSTTRTLEPVRPRPASPAEPLDLGGKLADSPIFYDQAFEDQTADTFKQPIITHDHVFSFRDADSKVDTTPVVERPDLRNHMVSRQSFIAAELLAPPLSKRGRKR